MPSPRLPIDVVVPSFRGEAQTRRAIESVLAARVERSFELTVIDDAGPEPALAAWLRDEAHRFTLRVHDRNRGFVATANEGLALHADRDVVLLNSDTEVADGWLDRLAAHAEADPAIGTLTPFSNNATICSYPKTLQPNELPPGETTASLDAAFAAANRGLNADIVTGVGFCLFVTRRCLDAIGPFDEARYGLGYGEEVDFCMRAARAGYRNAIAGDVFVRHVGEVSFVGAGADRRAKAQATVDALYPEFQERLRAFIPADPLRVLRRRADLERLRRSRMAVTVGGGEGLALGAAGDDLLELRWRAPGEDFAAWFRVPGDWARLEALVAGLAGRGPMPDADTLCWVPPKPRPVEAPLAAPSPALEQARARIRDLESSTSWRLTAPLRALARALRRV